MKIKYLLKDIEYWKHDNKNNYPIKITKNTFSNKINKKFSKNEIYNLENEIKKYFNRKSLHIETMNPLYQINGNFWTVMSIDIYTQNPVNISKYTNKPQKIDRLIKKYNNIVSRIFEKGGNLSIVNIKNSIRSKDKELFNLEEDIIKLINKDKLTILELIKKDNQNAIKAFQFLPKNNSDIDYFIKILPLVRNPKSKNLILKQLIPCIKNLKHSKQEIFFGILKKELIDANGQLRNKILVIFSKLDKKILINNIDKKLYKFISELSKTKQLNCSYPAKNIKTTLICMKISLIT